MMMYGNSRATGFALVAAITAAMLCAAPNSNATEPCVAPEFSGSYVWPRSTARLINPPKVIRKSNQRLRIVWRRPGLDRPYIRWFKGCRTGTWDAIDRYETPTDSAGRNYSDFNSLAAPEGSLDLWAIFEDWGEGPGDFEVGQILVHLRTVKFARTIERNSIESELRLEKGAGGKLSAVHTLNLTHQQRVNIEQRFVAHTCSTACTRQTLGVQRSVSPARSYVTATDEVRSPVEFPTVDPFARFEVSYERRYLPSSKIEIRAVDKSSLCRSIRAGRSVEIRVRTIVRDSETHGTILRARATHQLTAGTCR